VSALLVRPDPAQALRIEGDYTTARVCDGTAPQANPLLLTLSNKSAHTACTKPLILSLSKESAHSGARG
jgi:hypothetical protein